MKKVLLICGILAPLTYLITVLYGAQITPGYSHVAHAISELVMEESPLRWQIDPGFMLYNLLLILFGIGLVWEFRGAGKRGLCPIGFTLIAVGGLSLLMYIFPQDPREAELTFGGQMHLVLAGLVAFCSILAQVFGGILFQRVPGMERLSLYSYISAVWMFVTGGLSAAGVATSSPIFGIYERMTIGAIEVWVLILALVMTTRYLPRRAAV